MEIDDRKIKTIDKNEAIDLSVIARKSLESGDDDGIDRLISLYGCLADKELNIEKSELNLIPLRRHIIYSYEKYKFTWTAGRHRRAIRPPLGQP